MHMVTCTISDEDTYQLSKFSEINIYNTHKETKLCGTALTCADNIVINGCSISSPYCISSRHTDLNGGPTLIVTDGLSVGGLVCRHNYGVVTNGYVVFSSGTRLVTNENSSPRNSQLITALCDLKIMWSWKI